MKSFFEQIDISVSKWVLKNLSFPILRKVIPFINRGEIFAIILLGLSLVDQVVYPLFGFLYTGICAYLNDRLILLIKKKVYRKRPSIKLLDKPNNHPDLNHSFPSAHAANSMLVAVILCSEFQFSFILYFFSLFAGIGRLLTLHHFLSDIIGGWLIGLGFGVLSIFLMKYIKEFWILLV